MLKIDEDIIADQETRGFIEKVDLGEKTHRQYYMPHHAVKKISASTPICIVYDCSCRKTQEQPSLNDCWMSVTPKLNDLTRIIVFFRLHKYAVSTDTEKAFLSIDLHETDRNVTRFFWLSDPTDPKSPLITYRFRVVLFGTTCLPFILSATLMNHLKLNISNTAAKLMNDLYVDNVLSDIPDQRKLLEFYGEQDTTGKKRF